MLAARSVSVYRGGKALLRDVSLSVHPREVVAVIGPNGAGKSTFLKVLSGDIDPDEGGVQVEEQSIDEFAPRKLAMIRAVLPQESSLSFPFRVDEVVQMGRSPYAGGAESANDGEVIRAAIEAVDIQHLLHRDFTSLSGGERQRVHLARVMAQIWRPEPLEARYLLLDEPTSALDLAHQHQVLSTARQLAAEQNIGVLAILHDLNLAALYADRIAMLSQGRLAHLGGAAEVLSPGNIREVFGIETRVVQHEGLERPCVVALPKLRSQPANFASC